MHFNIENIIFPTKARLEASTLCQLKCAACVTGSGEVQNELGAGFLKFVDFQAFIARYPQIENIELSNWGEIFLNKDLLKILQCAEQQEVGLFANNGVNLNSVSEEVLQGLVRHRFRSMSCSIDGASQETYEVYRMGGNFDQVINNIMRVNQYKQELRSPYPALNWQFVVFGHNEHEIGLARQMAANLNMRFFLKLNWEGLYKKDNFSPIKDLELIRRESCLGVANRDEYRERYGKEYNHGCCMALWSDPQINFDGRVLGCPINYWEDYGNAFSSDLNDCLNGQKMRAARKALMGRRVKGKNVPCYRCNLFKMRAANGTWVKEEEIAKLSKHLSRKLLLKRLIRRNRFGRRTLNYILGMEKQVNRPSALGVEAMEARCSQIAVHRAAAEPPKFEMLKSRICQFPLPFRPEQGQIWKAYYILNGFSTEMYSLSCHVSALESGACPHPPHKHYEEEILLLLVGEAELLLSENEGLRKVRIKPGNFVYYPAGFAHTLQAVSREQANYLMFKWKGRFWGDGERLRYQLHNCFGFQEHQDKEQGFKSSLIFEGPTRYLRKLHCHSTILAPGAGYDAHKDDYDVAVILFEGEVETLGESFAPYSVIYYRAGEAHGMKNPGKEVAKYLVFELHSRDRNIFAEVPPKVIAPLS